MCAYKDTDSEKKLSVRELTSKYGKGLDRRSTSSSKRWLKQFATLTSRQDKGQQQFDMGEYETPQPLGIGEYEIPRIISGSPGIVCDTSVQTDEWDTDEEQTSFKGSLPTPLRASSNTTDTEADNTDDDDDDNDDDDDDDDDDELHKFATSLVKMKESGSTGRYLRQMKTRLSSERTVNKTHFQLIEDILELTATVSNFPKVPDHKKLAAYMSAVKHQSTELGQFKLYGEMANGIIHAVAPELKFPTPIGEKKSYSSVVTGTTKPAIAAKPPLLLPRVAGVAVVGSSVRETPSLVGIGSMIQEPVGVTPPPLSTKRKSSVKPPAELGHIKETLAYLKLVRRNYGVDESGQDTEELPHCTINSKVIEGMKGQCNRLIDDYNALQNKKTNITMTRKIMNAAIESTLTELNFTQSVSKGENQRLVTKELAKLTAARKEAAADRRLDNNVLLCRMFNFAIRSKFASENQADLHDDFADIARMRTELAATTSSSTAMRHGNYPELAIGAIFHEPFVTASATKAISSPLTQGKGDTARIAMATAKPINLALYTYCPCKNCWKIFA